jgi:hypothetical protein
MIIFGNERIDEISLKLLIELMGLIFEDTDHLFSFLMKNFLINFPSNIDSKLIPFFSYFLCHYLFINYYKNYITFKLIQTNKKKMILFYKKYLKFLFHFTFYFHIIIINTSKFIALQ